MRLTGKQYICAAEQDEHYAKKLAALLLDKTGDTPGFVPCPDNYQKGDLPEDVARRIKSSLLFYVIISQNSIESCWIKDQMELASQIDLLTIPVIVDSFRFEGQLGVSLGTADCISFTNELQMEKMLSNVSSWLKAEGNRGVQIKAVDLGLNVKWASCNLGTSFPDMPGDFYGWGEKSPRKKFGYKDYPLSNKGYSKGFHFETRDDGSHYVVQETEGLPYYKYNMERDGFRTLEPMDDPATLALGAPWRIPSRDEFQELVEGCDWEWVEATGNTIGYNTKDDPCLNGFMISSRNTRNSIFLPAAGINFYESFDEPTLMLSFGRQGGYWTRDLNSLDNAFGLYFNKSDIRVAAFLRKKGLCIRPVTDDAID